MGRRKARNGISKFNTTKQRKRMKRDIEDGSQKMIDQCPMFDNANTAADVNDQSWSVDEDDE
jgi:hypothetical protein